MNFISIAFIIMPIIFLILIAIGLKKDNERLWIGSTVGFILFIILNIVLWTNAF